MVQKPFASKAFALRAVKLACHLDDTSRCLATVPTETAGTTNYPSRYLFSQQSSNLKLKTSSVSSSFVFPNIIERVMASVFNTSEKSQRPHGK